VADDILDEVAGGTPRPSESYPRVPATDGLVVLHRASGCRGRLTRFTGDVVEIRDAGGRSHQFRNLPGAFAVQGETVILVRPGPSPSGASGATRRSAAGGVVAGEQRARVARASRLWVEGDHDARLVERVWGDELRELGIVVEPIGGLDRLEEALAAFHPGPGRTVVVLADHLVEGSKEQRIADRVASPHVRVVGHRFVDVWECVRPAALGIEAWPRVPRGEDWKTGVCSRLGWGSPAQGWGRVLAAVDDFTDLDPSLVGAVESALDLLVDPAELTGNATDAPAAGPAAAGGATRP
jgi:hypothetical protein